MLHIRDHLIFKQSKGKKSPFAMSLAIVRSRDSDATEDRRSISRVDAVLAETGPAPCFVPGEHGAL